MLQSLDVLYGLIFWADRRSLHRYRSISGHGVSPLAGKRQNITNVESLNAHSQSHPITYLASE